MNEPCDGRMSAMNSLKQRLRFLKDRTRKLEKFIEFLEHWEELNGKLDKEIEELLWEISHKLGG